MTGIDDFFTESELSSIDTFETLILPNLNELQDRALLLLYDVTRYLHKNNPNSLPFSPSFAYHWQIDRALVLHHLPAFRLINTLHPRMVELESLGLITRSNDNCLGNGRAVFLTPLGMRAVESLLHRGVPFLDSLRNYDTTPSTSDLLFKL